eukprot:m.121120 g.121120  ORF g.121120 m.121120 type:complete len:255 (-) comp23267_c0_seq11:3-767(-)
MFEHHGIDGLLFLNLKEVDLDALGIDNYFTRNRLLILSANAKNESLLDSFNFDYWTLRDTHRMEVNVVTFLLLTFPRSSVIYFYFFYPDLLTFLYPDFEGTIFSFWIPLLIVPQATLFVVAFYSLQSSFWAWIVYAAAFSQAFEAEFLFIFAEKERFRRVFRDTFWLFCVVLGCYLWPSFLPDVGFWVFYVRNLALVVQRLAGQLLAVLNAKTGHSGGGGGSGDSSSSGTSFSAWKSAGTGGEEETRRDAAAGD